MRAKSMITSLERFWWLVGNFNHPDVSKIKDTNTSIGNVCICSKILKSVTCSIAGSIAKEMKPRKFWGLWNMECQLFLVLPCVTPATSIECIILIQTIKSNIWVIVGYIIEVFLKPVPFLTLERGGNIDAIEGSFLMIDSRD